MTFQVVEKVFTYTFSAFAVIPVFTGIQSFRHTTGYMLPPAGRQVRGYEKPE